MQFSTFSFAQQYNVRVFEQDGMAWFVASDICNALELTNSSKAISILDEDERATAEIKTTGGIQKVSIINESGLYILILRSRKAMERGTVAWKFRKWVTTEVLPTIRKTGSYQNPQHGQGYLNDWEQEQIRQAVKVRSIRTGETTQAIYTKLHAYMGCDSYMNICQEDFQVALNFLASMENAPTLFTKPKLLHFSHETIQRNSTPIIGAINGMIRYFEQTYHGVKVFNPKLTASAIEYYRILRIYTPKMN